jgi:3-deoxy-D-manno-octulosonic-acid transferase
MPAQPVFDMLAKLFGRTRQALALPPPRPSGPLVWLHVSTPDHSAAALALARQMVDEHGLHVLITGLDDAPNDSRVMTARAPKDTAAHVQAFLAHTAPQVIVLIGATLRPVLIAQSKAQKCPVLLIEAEAPVLLRGSNPLRFGALRRAALMLHAIMTVDEASARTFRKLGAVNVTRLGRMQQGSQALPYNEPERAALASVFATRPVWLAVDVPQVEEAAVIAAHRAALRLSHRLLLVLVPQDLSRAAALATELEQSDGWIVARRDLEQDPDPETAVYIADAGQEYGLWYRLAPVTFMGGSLFGAGCARSPMEAAALGSAIIHGRKVGDYGQAFGRLGAALGAVPVSSAPDLAEALADLLAPDRAARAAHAAWAVTSEGAEAIDRIVQITARLAKGQA